MSLLVTASGENPQMKAVEDFESRPHKAVPFVVERERETRRCRSGMSRKDAQGAAWLQWRKVAER